MRVGAAPHRTLRQHTTYYFPGATFDRSHDGEETLRVILVRIPPHSKVPGECIVTLEPEMSFTGSPIDYLRFALTHAKEGAEDGQILSAAATGLVDGLEVTAVILGTVDTGERSVRRSESRYVNLDFLQ